MVQIKHFDIDLQHGSDFPLEHNLGNKYVIVQIYEGDAQQPLPSSFSGSLHPIVRATNENVVTLEMENTPRSRPLHVVVMG